MTQLQSYKSTFMPSLPAASSDSSDKDRDFLTHKLVYVSIGPNRFNPPGSKYDLGLDPSQYVNPFRSHTAAAACGWWWWGRGAAWPALRVSNGNLAVLTEIGHVEGRRAGQPPRYPLLTPAPLLTWQNDHMTHRLDSLTVDSNTTLHSAT